jgi:alpha-L-rhamnosidase
MLSNLAIRNSYNRISVLFVFVLFSLSSYAQPHGGAPADLRCEYLTEPLGVDANAPRLSWLIDDDKIGAKQTAYQISVGAAPNRSDQWKSGKVLSDRSLVRYTGKKLLPNTKYYWSVTVWDKNGKPTISGPSFFVTGMRGIENWTGTWISDGDEHNILKKEAPMFRREFSVQKKIRSAIAYIAVAGLYELSINGRKVGDHVLDPMYTRFDRRNLYVTYDITNQLKAGKNAIGVLLGNGWYNLQSFAVWNLHEAPWRNRPTFCLDLKLTYEDGSTETIASDKNWKTATGPVIFNSIYTGEHYDARLEQTGWDIPGFDDKKWSGVENRSAPAKNIVSQLLHPIRYVEEIHPKTIRKINDSVYLYDLGRTIAGVSQITLKGDAGTTIQLQHAERIYDNGRVNMTNLVEHYRPKDDTDPFQTDIYILSGKGPETFKPHFNYKGFRYIEVRSSKAISLDLTNVTAFFMHSDVPAIGALKTSNKIINGIWSAGNNSYLSNLYGYPTDCPQREKNGWTGDAHTASETGLYNFDGITVYEKWIADHQDEQQPNGTLPSIIPTGGWGYEWGNGPDWTSTIAIIPWNIYMFYGDNKLLEQSYPNIKRYVDKITNTSDGHLTTWGLGDWLPVKTQTPVELTSSIFYYVDANILAKAAKLFGKTDDQKKYSQLAEQIKIAINAKYLNNATGLYGEGNQTAMSAPLFWGVVPADMKATVIENLVKRVHADGDKLDVGLLGSKTILNALSENGHADLAFKLASSDKFPSWGWWIANGATTMYENWKIDEEHMSLNHIMYGEISAWFYKTLGGIKPDEQQPGFKNILLNPQFVNLDSSFVSFKTVHGKVISAWEKKENSITYHLTIPANSTGKLFLPNNVTLYSSTGADGSKQNLIKQKDLSYQIASGSYNFVLKEKIAQ